MRLPHRTLHIVAPAIVVLQASLLISCGAGDAVDPLAANGLTTSAERHRAREIALSASDSSLTTGQQVQATAVVRDQSGHVITNAPVTWSVEKSSIATVSSTGLITGGGTTGSTIVSASIDGVTRGLVVDVSPEGAAADTTSGPAAADTTSGPAAADTTASADTTAQSSTTSPAVHMVSITANATTLKIGEVTQISGVVRDAKGTPIANVPITWSASPTSVATIASTGATTALLTAKGTGTATVYAKADTTVRYISVTVIDSATATTTAPVTGGATGGSYGSATAAELPRATVNTAYPSAARQVRVPAGANLQAAIDAAQPGDELLLAPGAVYSGNFYLRNKGALNGWITIRTDLSDAAIGAPGTRMTPSRAASANLARIETPNLMSALITEIGANHYRFSGVEITAVNTGAELNTIVRLGDNTTAQNSAATTANSLVFDRTYIHAPTSMWVRRCVMLNSASTAIVDSWLGDCHSNSGDSQAIAGWNGSGPYLIENNHLEGGHEVIVFGGGGSTVQNQSPSDITIRRNHIMRPASWKGVWQAKNLIESKHSRRVLIEGNVIENSWADAQVGFAFVMKSENQNWDTPWTQTTDITIRNNKIRNVGSVFNLAANPSGAPAVPAARFVITDNVVENVNVGQFTGDGRLFQLLPGVSDVVLMHNTMVSANGGNSGAIIFDSPSISRLVVHSNILSYGAYGVKGAATTEGTVTLNTFAPGWLFTNNAIVAGSNANAYPASTWFTSSLSTLGVVDPNGDFRLSSSSAFIGKGYDGRDIGADVSQVNSLTSNVVVAP